MAENPRDSGGAIAALVSQRKWGGPTRLVPPVNVVTGVTRSRLVLNNPKRVGLIITNLGPSRLSVGPSLASLISFGLDLGYDGGTLVVTADEDGELVTQDWYGATSPVAGGVTGPGSAVIWEVEVVG